LAIESTLLPAKGQASAAGQNQSAKLKNTAHNPNHPMQLIILILVFASSTVSAGSIIKCQAADGSITYADSRCPAGQQQLSKQSHQQVRRQSKASIKNLQKGAEFPESGKLARIPRLLFQTRFSQALSSLMVLRNPLVEYYIYRGQWPRHLEDIGLDSKQMTSSQIVVTELAERGRLKAQLKPEFGDDKVIWLYPKEVMGGTQIEWTCYSNFPVSLLTGPTGFRLCESRYF
jgi:hypothetical protein